MPYHIEDVKYCNCFSY